jgi:hypothetical protein
MACSPITLQELLIKAVLHYTCISKTTIYGIVNNLWIPHEQNWIDPRADFKCAFGRFTSQKIQFDFIPPHFFTTPIKQA